MWLLHLHHILICVPFHGADASDDCESYHYREYIRSYILDNDGLLYCQHKRYTLSDSIDRQKQRSDLNHEYKESMSRPTYRLHTDMLHHGYIRSWDLRCLLQPFELLPLSSVFD